MRNCSPKCAVAAGFDAIRDMGRIDTERMRGQLYYHSTGRHHTADSARKSIGDYSFRNTDQSFLDGVDGQRGSDRVQGRALPGSELY